MLQCFLVTTCRNFRQVAFCSGSRASFKRYYLSVQNTVSFGLNHCIFCSETLYVLPLNHCIFRTKTLYLSVRNTVCFTPKRLYLSDQKTVSFGRKDTVFLAETSKDLKRTRGARARTLAKQEAFAPKSSLPTCRFRRS